MFLCFIAFEMPTGPVLVQDFTSTGRVLSHVATAGWTPASHGACADMIGSTLI